MAPFELASRRQDGGALAALGTLRLAELPQADAIAAIHAALDRGVRWLDTADVYGVDGAGERLVQRALEGRDEDVRVITKGGLRRGPGPWRPDGRRRHLLDAAQQSAERLGRVPDLYLLHAPDPRTPLGTSIRALEAIRERGLARAVGVSNVRRDELREACAAGCVAAVQVALSPLDDGSLRGGVVTWAHEQDIPVFAHSPFGGPKRARSLGKHPALSAVARRVQRSPHAVALSWLTSLGVIPIAGPSTVAHVTDLFPLPALDASDLAELDAAFTASNLVRSPQRDRRPPSDGPGDVVLLMGGPASGKSTHAAKFAGDGYHRLNRDLLGGTLTEVAAALDRALADGHRRVILDNTYPDRAARNRVIETAWRHGVPVRCLHQATSTSDAALNACLRLIRRHGRLLEPDELSAAARSEPNTFPPRVLLQWPSKLEAPQVDEGFASVVELPFHRAPTGEGRALVLDAAELRPEHAALAARYRAAGWSVFAAGWTGGRPAPGDVIVGDQPIETVWCTHPPGPPVCWCRPPLPGLVAVLMLRHGLGDVRSPADPPPEPGV